MRRIHVTLVLAAALSIATPALAQSVTASDIQRLQESTYQAGTEVSQMRPRDSGAMQANLDDLRDEVIYLKVKLRKQGSVSRSEFADVRDRIDDLRNRARNNGSSPSSQSSAAAPRDSRPGNGSAMSNEVPSGTEIDVRLIDNLNSGTTRVEDRFEATTLDDLLVNDRVLIPAGAAMRGVVTDVQPATRTNRKAQMTVSFDQVTIRDRSYPIRATVTQALEGEGIKGEKGRIGAGAGVGAIIGGLLGGFKGAMAGILIGGGGTIAATEGKQVEIPQGTVLRVRFDSPVTIR